MSTFHDSAAAAAAPSHPSPASVKSDEYMSLKELTRVVTFIEEESFDKNDQFRKETSPLLVHSGPPPEAKEDQEQKQEVEQEQDQESSSKEEYAKHLQLVSLLMAKEMTRMAGKEREEAMEDLHGVANLVNETDEFVRVSLEQLGSTLANMPRGRAEAYMEAKAQNESYVTDKDFLIMFLRADKFDVESAAQRLVFHFKLKKELFGSEKLAKDITFDDMSEEDIKILQTGFVEHLPSRDRAGRLVIKVRTIDVKSRLSVLRVAWFGAMKAVRGDALTQICGVVVINYNLGIGRVIDPSVYKDLLGGGFKALPMRRVAMHYLFDDIQVAPCVIHMRYYMDPQARLRFRHYLGTVNDYHIELRRFGIPVSAFNLRGPIEAALIFRTQQRYCGLRTLSPSEKHDLMIENGAGLLSVEDGATNLLANQEAEQKSSEDETRLSSLITTLHPNDVLYGRGRSRYYLGNLRVQGLVKAYMDDFNNARRSEKTAIAERIVQQVINSGGRFLKPVENAGVILGYILVDQGEARSKIINTFRTSKKSEVHKKGA